MGAGDPVEGSVVFKRLLSLIGYGGGPARKEMPGHMKLALPLAIAGIAILNPGIRDALMSFLNTQLHLGLSLEAPWYMGPPAIMLAAGIYFYGEHGARAAAKPPGTFVALHHESFEPPTRRLPDSGVPARLGHRNITHVECDQSLFFSDGTADPAGAVRQQNRAASDITAIRRADPDAAIGYYGIVHVPLQFLAGCTVSTWHEVALFELNRADQQWRELEEGRGPDLGLTVQTVSRPARPVAAVVRIAISYDVPVADVAEVVVSPFEDIRVGITPPRIDAVTHYGQVAMICVAFRQILDNIQARLGKDTIIHIFYAGPVSLGFSLGRRISRTIHHRVRVHNYSVRATPRYTWSIEVNGDPSALPRIVQPVRPSASPAGNP